MSSENIAKGAAVVFGAAGTATSVSVGGATPTTNTSNAFPLPRQDITVQLTSITTGTSGCLATTVVQASNDNQAWFAIGSSTASATSAAAPPTATRATAGIALANMRYALARTVVTLTGTGSATVFMGS